MSKEDVIEYVMTTPSNPNRAVLSGMLDSIAEAGGGSAEPLIVNLVWDEDNERYYGNKTYGEIKTAFMAGTKVVYVTENTWDTVFGLSENLDSGYTGYAYYGNGQSSQTGQKSSYEEMLATLIES